MSGPEPLHQLLGKECQVTFDGGSLGALQVDQDDAGVGNEIVPGLWLTVDNRGALPWRKDDDLLERVNDRRPRLLWHCSRCHHISCELER